MPRCAAAAVLMPRACCCGAVVLGDVLRTAASNEDGTRVFFNFIFSRQEFHFPTAAL